MRKPLAAAIAVAMALASCAKDANQVGASYISPITYQSYTCPQLAEEAQRVSARAAETAGVQDQKATNDKVAVGVGLIIFWPALLFAKGNDENTAELARLKGQDVYKRQHYNLIFDKPRLTSASRSASSGRHQAGLSMYHCTVENKPFSNGCCGDQPSSVRNLLESIA